jgi:hypothetical protein
MQAQSYMQLPSLIHIVTAGYCMVRVCEQRAERKPSLIVGQDHVTLMMVSLLTLVKQKQHQVRPEC